MQEVFEVKIIVRNEVKAAKAREQGYTVLPLEQIGSVDIIFLAVLISGMEGAVRSMADYVHENQLVVDLCSVKVHPVKVMKNYLEKPQILATHPMFGPDSAKKGLKGMRVAFCPVRVEPENAGILRDFWVVHGVEVIETIPEKHDQDNAYSLAFSHIMAKVFNNMHFPELTFTTRSFNDISEVARLSANDTDQLFHDMLYYNPFLSDMLNNMQQSIASTLHDVETIRSEQRAANLYALDDAQAY